VDKCRVDGVSNVLLYISNTTECRPVEMVVWIESSIANTSALRTEPYKGRCVDFPNIKCPIEFQKHTP